LEVDVVYEPLSKIRNYKWEDVILPVQLPFGKSEQVHAKKTEYYFPIEPMVTAFMRVTVFVTPRGHVWAGPQQLFYIETQSGVIGGRFHLGNIFWCDSLLHKQPGEKLSLDSALKRLEREVDKSQLTKAYSKKTPERVTDTYEIFVGLLFSPEPDVGCEEVYGITLEGKVVRVDFRRPDTGEACLGDAYGQHTLRQVDLKSLPPGPTGSAWIDIESKKLLRAAVNGKQVFAR
jgi:hypothetical protein